MNTIGLHDILFLLHNGGIVHLPSCDVSCCYDNHQHPMIIVYHATGHLRNANSFIGQQVSLMSSMPTVHI